MKPLSSAIAAALILFSRRALRNKPRSQLLLLVPMSWLFPPSQEHPPFDLNHMGTGSDKSDALGVPYYNQHAM
ncbi:multiple antibiotic resistance protein MarB [Escherichia coli]|nr:multiple antibiotic resistance protein MarB [Escherichia coli]